MSDGSGGGLARWSQRKHAAREAARRRAAPTVKDADAPTRPDVAPQSPPEMCARLPANMQAETPADEQPTAQRPADDARPSLPPIEELTADSDYAQFLADGVPEALKRAALRKLWNSDPVLACLDGLNDYDEDFNVIDTMISAADTNYKVGRGFFDMDEPEPAAEPRTTTAAEPVQASADEMKPEQEAGEGKQRSAVVAAEDDCPPDSAREDGPHRLAAGADETPAAHRPSDSDQKSKG